MNAHALAARYLEEITRERILAEARSWIGTPWHHAQMAKGPTGGVDCGMLLIAVFSAIGIASDIDPGRYPPDWHLHREDDRMRRIVESYAKPVENPKPGDVALYKYGLTTSHAAIIENEEMIIHAFILAKRVCRTERSSLEDVLVGYWSIFP